MHDPRAPTPHPPAPDDVREQPASEVIARLGTSAKGLTASEADRRRRDDGPNSIRFERPPSRIATALHQIANPLLLLLVFAAAASLLTRQYIDAAVVLSIVIVTVAVGYAREYSAVTALAALRSRLRIHVTALRDGSPATIPAEDVVRGDVILLAAGSLVPADGLLLDSTDLYVSESVLTGESFPVLKQVSSTRGVPLLQRIDCVFLGTNVRSGTGRFVVVDTGPRSELGRIAHRLAVPRPVTEFDRGIRRFGYLLTSAMLVLVIIVFAINVISGRPPIETLLFSIALAVGLSPELLPAILSVNLARGAERLARRGVLVRRLPAIENLGAMDVLCTDKTGTLTEGVVRLEGAYDPTGTASADVLRLAAINAALETGISSPLDEAIEAAHTPDLQSLEKLGEIPFDFVRKRVTVAIRDAGGLSLVTKGAVREVLDACTTSYGDGALSPAVRETIERTADAWADRGIRTLAVATQPARVKATYTRQDESGMTFRGFLTFVDQPKSGAREAVAALGALGISIKVITGDNARVAAHVAGLVGLDVTRLTTGAQIGLLHDDALSGVADRTVVFAEVTPAQKERIVQTLKQAGHVVAFLGDGVNDAPAMHASDTSLSVDTAVDVAREAADFVLLERGLDVIRAGVEEGRRTSANTLKYVLTTTSANLGNMISMAAASLWLPFLPLTAGQILLNNFLSDVPAIGIATDTVDAELVERPRRWHMGFIGRYMLAFGLLSSIFDAITFAALLIVPSTSPDLFRTGWFVESLLTEVLVALVMRTRRRFYRSRPGSLLLQTTIVVVVIAWAFPICPARRSSGSCRFPRRSWR